MNSKHSKFTLTKSKDTESAHLSNGKIETIQEETGLLQDGETRIQAFQDVKIVQYTYTSIDHSRFTIGSSSVLLWGKKDDCSFGFFSENSWQNTQNDSDLHRTFKGYL